MRSIIVGTAGHIDHGKTSLVRRLTGIDTDRLEEEKRRGISIELGFAHLDLGEGVRAGFVDVPGHERFVRTMLAGVSGIDVVLLVIGADEGIKPQTREHFDICRLLGVERGIVVLTKADLVDAEWMELVRMEVEEFVAGSFLERAPVLPVSAKTGEGIEALQTELRKLAHALKPRDAAATFRLPIDRSFAMKGFGTVVTGTLMAGSVAVEQEVELYPTGRRLRVRGLQVHGKAAAKAVAGQRTAVNLAGIEHGQIERGMVLSEPGWFEPVRVVDARLQLLPSAKALKLRTLVHLHAGTAETVAEMRLLEGTALQPGESAWVRLRLRTGLLLLPADRCILRQFSPVVTLGGATVAEIAPPRRTNPERLQALAAATPAAAALLLVTESAVGLDRAALRRKLGVAPELPNGLIACGSHVVAHSWAQARLSLAEKALAAFHRANPLQAGMPKEELRGKVLPQAPAHLFDALLAMTTKLTADQDLVRLSTHQVQLREDESAAREKMEQAFRQGGLATPGLNDVLAHCGVEGARAKLLLQMLLKERRLVKVSEDLVYHADTLTGLKALLTARKGQSFGVGEFKEWTGVSRKYAIPLLELLDRERITRRAGEQRLIL
jgi:selenocysteine-specific elongation factor